MFTFLRKIRLRLLNQALADPVRKSLMESGSTRKYIFYAIGEIALVVIGILIALQINNWNEGKKLAAKEKNALTEILSDLDVNIHSLENILNSDENNITQAIQSINIVLSYLEDSSAYQDSLSIHFRNVYNYPNVDLKVSGYESLTSMGMDLISNNQIRSEIGKYYSFIVPFVSKAKRELRDDFYKYMLGDMQEKFIAIGENNRIRLLKPLDFDELKKNTRYNQTLKMYLDLFEFYKQQTLIVLEESKIIRENIRNFYWND